MREKRIQRFGKSQCGDSYFDFELIKKHEKNSLKDYFKNNNDKWIKGTGLHIPSKDYNNKENLITPDKTINTTRVSRYLVNESNLQDNNTEYLKIDKKIN